MGYGSSDKTAEEVTESGCDVEQPLADRRDDIGGFALELKHNKAGVSGVGSPGTGVPGSRPPSYATHVGPKPMQDGPLKSGAFTA
jgi:hypothetical protein